MKLAKVQPLALLVVAAAIAFLGTGGCSSSPAASYPSKEVTYIVGWAPGSSADRVARALADVASPILGKPIVVKNLPGASSTLAVAELVKAKPDGYTVAMAPSINLTIHPHMQSLPYSFDDLEILSLIWSNPYVWVVKADSPYKTLADLMNDAKAKQGKVTYGNAGLGTAGHLAVEVFSKQTGTKLAIVPFKGGNTEAVTSLLGGHIDSALVGMVDVVTHVEEGRVRVLGASMKFPGMDKVGGGMKSMKELGYDIEFAGTMGHILPKGVPKEVSEKLGAAFKKGTEDKGFIDALEKMKLFVTYVPGAETTAQWKKDSDAFKPIVKDLGLKLE